MGKIKRKVLSLMLDSAANKTGRKKKELESDLRCVRRQYGISTSDYMLKGMYRLSIDEIKDKFAQPQNLKKDFDVELVAEMKGISYEEAKSEMDKLLEKYDILYKEYTANKLYVYKTKKGLKKRIDRILEKNEKYLQEVCDDAGWTYEKAKSEAARVKKAFGITYKQFSRYRFYSMTDEEISAYIATGEPMDKAGAYGIQGKACSFVRELHGDYYTVMGMPVCRLTELLRHEFCFDILKNLH